MGVTSISLEDIDIAHRVPARNDSRYKPIICKFSRANCKRIININKVNPNSAGLPPGSQLSEARVYDHLTPSLQTLLYEAKKFQQQYSYKFCWVSNSKILLRNMMTLVQL